MSEESGRLFKEAAAILENVRREQAGSGKPLFGATHISRERKSLIHAISSTHPVIIGVRKEMGIDQSLLDNMFERFEEMCRRREITINKELYPAILENLATELWINAESLKGSPDRLASATIYNGAIGPKLIADYPEFKESPAIYRDAATQNPTDPPGYLKRLREIIADVSGNPEFALFSDTPSTYREAGRKHPKDTAAFLRRAVKNYHDIMGEQEFALLRDTPGIVKEAVIDHVTDPRAFLRGIKTAAEKLAFDEEFADFWKPKALEAAKAARADKKADTSVRIPSLFKHVAANYRKTTRDLPAGGENSDASELLEGMRDFLRGIKRTVAELKADEEFAVFRKAPGIYTLAAVKHRDPQAYLRSVKRDMTDYSQLEKYAEIQMETPGDFRYAATHYSDNPAVYLDRKVRRRQESHAAEVSTERRGNKGPQEKT